MTEKQKQAIKLLNSLWNANGGMMRIGEEDYFLLMEFVVGTPTIMSQKPWNIPAIDTPITVMYGCLTDGITYANKDTSNAETSAK